MAENKASFLLYTDMIHTVKKLPKLKRAELFMAILEYVNDENPVIKDNMVDLVFEPIKHQLKRDLKKWETFQGKKSDAGILGNLKRWHKDLYDKVLAKELTIQESQIIAQHRTAIPPIAPIADIAVNVTDTVNANVTVSDIYSDSRTFLKYRKEIFQSLPDEIKNKLADFGLTAPMVRNTSELNRQYVDVVEIIVNVINDHEWKALITKNFHLSDKRRGELLEDFIRLYITDPEKVYDADGFKGHFVNWLKKKMK